MIPALLQRLRARWIRTVRLAGGLAGLAAALPALGLAAALPRPWGVGGWSLTALGVGAGLALALPAWRRAGLAGPEAIARHLDRTVPELEESAGLLIVREDRLTPLQRLQRRRILDRLPAVEGRARVSRAPLRRAAGWLAGGAALAALLAVAVPALPRPAAGSAENPAVPPAPPALASARITVTPPAYTGLPAEQVEGLDVAARVGSTLTWSLRADGDVGGAALVLEGEPHPLERDGDRFRTELELDGTQLYYVSLLRGGREVARSGFARLRAVPDLPPELRLLDPESSREIPVAALGDLDLRVEARDDLGLTGAEIVATLAQGSGEQVRFRERRIPFPDAPTGTRSLLGRTLDLRALGLGPGSELYLHVEGTDNRRPEPNRSRTATVRLRVPGGPDRSIDLGRGLPILDPPEFLRSQRQIILDTETLLEQRGALLRDAFEYRSQLIGDDQSALRMRYGAILGEETEDGSPLEQEDHEDETEEVLAGDSPDVSATVEALPQELMHIHDSEESATFFPDPVRRTFREMLGRMWSAERLLRTNRPDEALTHEYEALRLLKSVQEASRVYTQKVGFEPPPLDPEGDRLTGDLAEIPDRSEARPGPEAAPDEAALRHALAALARAREGDAPADLPGAVATIRGPLEARARTDPGIDLEALDVAADLAAGPPATVDPRRAAILEAALWSLLPPPETAPEVAAPAGGSLERAYLKALEAAP
ncbi:MAG: hypothetical protein PVF68_08010 [Acidobacteriota bacterium]|jgi:hypothetical protein